MKLHDIHHATPNYNYGFIDMTMDKLFNTYSQEIPNYAIKIINSNNNDGYS
jgi:sterol desaturase/sphingolipid hydroxylase (fatty acid hydroxylase superfamily)